uniref:F-box domain-containing protein n=1 Tax=Caenorhabditis tropicalis TaxID=1561998 RepID=A0A1I7U8H3_9PELO
MEQLYSLLYRFYRFLFPFQQSPLPLPSLPQLAYKNVIDLMSVREQVTLSLCSQRTNSIVKNLRHRPKSLELWILQENRVTVATGPFEKQNSRRDCYSVIQATRTSFFDPVETVIIGEHRVPVRIKTVDGYQYIETYWDDENLGLRTIADYIGDLFCIDLFCMKLMDDHRRMFDWLRDRPSFARVLHIRGMYRSNKEFSLYDFNFPVPNTAYLTREDGTKASFGLSGINEFTLVVWPDSTGKTYELFD